MTVEPGGKGAGAGGHGHMRASDADREQVIDVLKAAFAQGRLTKDELDARVGQGLASRTYADLDALTSDIPRGFAAAQPPRSAPAGIRAPSNAKVRPRDGAIIAPAILAGLALVAAVLLTGSPVAGVLFLGAVGSVFVSLSLLAVQVRGSRRGRRAGGPPPLERTLDTGPEADQPAVPSWPKPGRQSTTDAARTHRRRPRTVVPSRA